MPIKLLDRLTTYDAHALQLINLESRADSLGRTYGQPPLNWHEFQKAQTEEILPAKVNLPMVLAGMAAGGFIGMAASFAIINPVVSMSVIAVSAGVGAVAGGSNLLGSYGMRTSQIDAYEKYLNNFETSQMKTRQHTQEMQHSTDIEKPSVPFITRSQEAERTTPSR